MTAKITEFLLPFQRDLLSLESKKINATLVSGVNGVGKTTTIGKLGKFFKDNQKMFLVQLTHLELQLSNN